DLEILTEQLIERMSGDLGIDLINDTKLLNGLIVHLRPAIHRLKFDMTHNNPLTDEIFQQYHHIVERLRIIFGAWKRIIVFALTKMNLHTLRYILLQQLNVFQQLLQML